MKKFVYGSFDVANSPFQVLIISLIFSAYFANHVVGDPKLGSSYWQWTVGACALLVALVGIYLGQCSDQVKKGRRKIFIASTLICIVTTLFLWRVEPNPTSIIYCLIIFFIANFFFEISQMFYNSYLFNFSEKKNTGYVSGLSFALGFIGILPLVLFLLNSFILPDNTLFNLDKTKFEHIRIVPVLVAGWFFIFSIPIFKEVYNAKPRKTVKKRSQSTFDMVYKKNKFTNIGKYLIARVFYADAIIAMQTASGIFAVQTYGLTLAEIFKLYFFSSFSAAAGSLIGGYYNDKVGSKNVIVICIFFLVLTVIAMSIGQTKIHFFIAMPFGVFFFGAIQSASRVLMTRFLKSDNLGQGFGLFTLASRSTAIIGPIMVGTITYFTNLRTGYASIIILLLIGLFVLNKVKVPQNY